MSGLSGISLYEPEELVLTAAAGTPLAEIDALLSKQNQQLAFEPADFGRLFGGAPERQTIGGVIAGNIAGPRRIKAGAARDHFLGFMAVNGRGEAFKAGGRVVKNVTGYDLPKLIAGSFGTLAVLTEVTVKVLPAPETTRTLLLFGLGDDDALRALSEALQSPAEVSGAAHLPSSMTVRSGVAQLRWARSAVTAIRLEGFEPSVAARTAALKRLLGRHGPIEMLDDQHSFALWREIGEVAPYVGGTERLVWKLSVPPADGAGVLRAIRKLVRAEAFYDWGGGLIWLFLDEHGDGNAGMIRDAVQTVGGNATLIRAPEPVRAVTPVFHPQPGALAALSERVKDSFDPQRILNPGRMYAGV
jgi:glycolate oxidase FAD binding subunit